MCSQDKAIKVALISSRAYIFYMSEKRYKYKIDEIFLVHNVSFELEVLKNKNLKKTLYTVNV